MEAAEFCLTNMTHHFFIVVAQCVILRGEGKFTRVILLVVSATFVQGAFPVVCRVSSLPLWVLKLGSLVFGMDPLFSQHTRYRYEIIAETKQVRLTSFQVHITIQTTDLAEAKSN